MASYAKPMSLGTTAGQLQQGSQNMLVDIGNRWKNNSTVTGLVTGALIDNARTQGNTASAIQYNSAFMGDMLRNQTALEQQRTGNAATLMGIEGNVTKDLLAVSGDQQRRGTAEEGKQERLNIAARGTEERAGYETQGTQNRLGYVTQGEQERLNIAARGVEDRAQQDNESNNVIRLRNDARRQIAQQGARFYG